MKLTSQITEMVSAKITQGKCMLWAIMSMELHIQLFDFNLKDFLVTVCSHFCQKY